MPRRPDAVTRVDRCVPRRFQRVRGVGVPASRLAAVAALEGRSLHLQDFFVQGFFEVSRAS